MIQPARVLPSNAPPLAEGGGDGSSHVSRVLQEHSGNRQHNDYSYSSLDSGQKYPAAVLTENSYAGHQPHHQHQHHHHHHQPAHVYRQTPLQRHTYRYAPRNHLGNDDQAKAEKLAKHLYTRFTHSDHYMKYRNKQGPKGDKGGGDKIWPDRLELAFFQALVRWPPMGRRKLHHKDKQRGRNELIADYIEELTGEARTRKQVSSHIQVLKPFVEGDSFIMKWLSKEDLCGGGHSGRWYGGSGHGSGRMRSNYPVTAPPHNLRNAAPAMSHYDAHALAKVKGMLEVFEPTDFQMFVQRKYGEDSVDRLHTYTGSITHPRQPDDQIPDWTTFAQQYPLLTRMHTERPLDCNILVANASLAFPAETWKDKDGSALPGVELGISFLCSSRHLPAHSQVQCQNSFYKDGKFLKDHSGHSTVPLTLSEDGTTVETQVKFGSLFWARTLSYLAGRLRESGDHTKDPTEDVEAYIKGITASQEIMLTTEHGHERLLVIYWKFRLSTGSRGRAYWQKIKMPASPKAVEYIQQPKDSRSDSVYDYGMSYTDPSTSHLLQPSLQSPFEYDASSSGGGSAPQSATWPPSMEDLTNTAPPSAVDFPTGDNSFDFSGSNMNFSYDPSTFDLSTFDSSAFDFATGTTNDFAADPALQDYSTQDYSTQWCDGYASASDTQQQQQASLDTSTAYPMTTSDDTSQAALLAFDSQQSVAYPITQESSQSQNIFDSFGSTYENSYGSHAHHQDAGQAYGGAGQEMSHPSASNLKDEEDPLAALADASSFLTRGMVGET